MTRIALEQLELPAGQLEANTRHVLDQVALAIRDECDVVVLPELSNTGYVVEREAVQTLAQSLDGPFVNSLIAATSGTDSIVFAGFCERDGDSFFNSVVGVGRTGPVLHYRKIHLFDLEREVYEPGDDLPLLHVAGYTLGVCVCYDLRFVEVLRGLALRGADAVIAPAAWVTGYDASTPVDGMSQQATAAVVQANLNQVAVIAVSQVGPSTPELTMLGGSVAANSWGETLVGPLSRTSECSARIDLDLIAERSAQVRGPRIRPRADRRTDLYSVGYLGESL